MPDPGSPDLPVPPGPGPDAPAGVPIRLAVGACVGALCAGVLIGMKIGGGMPEAKVVEVPVRVPCRNCAERERTGQDAAPRTFSAMAPSSPDVVTNGDSSMPPDPIALDDTAPAF